MLLPPQFQPLEGQVTTAHAADIFLVNVSLCLIDNVTHRCTTQTKAHEHLYEDDVSRSMALEATYIPF